MTKFRLGSLIRQPLVLLGPVLIAGCHVWTMAPILEGDGAETDAAALLGSWNVLEVAEEATQSPIPVELAFAEDRWLTLSGTISGRPGIRRVAFGRFGSYFLVSVEGEDDTWLLARATLDNGGNRLILEAIDVDALQAAIDAGDLQGVVKPGEYRDVSIEVTTPSAALAAYIALHPQLLIGPAAVLERPDS